MASTWHEAPTTSPSSSPPASPSRRTFKPTWSNPQLSIKRRQQAAAAAAAAAANAAAGNATAANTANAGSRRASVASTPNSSPGLVRETDRKNQTQNQDIICHKEPYHVLGRVMLLGDSGVGKTCLYMRFRDGHFLSGNFISTVGIDFRYKVVTVDGVKVKLQIWDTAGQERFRSIAHAYYRDAHALLLLYDVTNKSSFDNIRAWLGEIREYAQDDVVIMLLGNKADCGSGERVVRREEGERLAREYNVAFMETSAKTGVNVEVSFMAVARELKSRKSNDPDEQIFNVHEFVREQTQKPSCPQCTT